MSDTKRKVWKIVSGVLVMVSATLVILSMCACVRSSANSSEPKVREPVGYAIVNGERYDITRYATNYGIPYIWTTDGMKILGMGITVFIPED